MILINDKLLYEFFQKAKQLLLTQNMVGQEEESMGSQLLKLYHISIPTDASCEVNMYVRKEANKYRWPFHATDALKPSIQNVIRYLKPITQAIYYTNKVVKNLELVILREGNMEAVLTLYLVENIIGVRIPDPVLALIDSKAELLKEPVACFTNWYGYYSVKDQFMNAHPDAVFLETRHAGSTLVRVLNPALNNVFIAQIVHGNYSAEQCRILYPDPAH